MLYDADEINLIPRIPWGKILSFMFLLFGFIPLGLAFGLCRWEPGARAYLSGSGASLFFRFLFYAIMVHALLIFPLTTLVYPQYPFGKTKRGVVALALISLPLLSFGYFVSDGMSWNDLNELFLFIFPASVLGFVFYERTQRPWIFSLFIATGTFIPFFVVGDLLSPFRLLRAYASNGSAFYFLRVFVPVASVVFVLVNEATDSRRYSEKWKGVAIALGAVILYGLVFHLGLPELSRLFGGERTMGMAIEFSWPGYVAGACGGLVVATLLNRDLRDLLFSR